MGVARHLDIRIISIHTTTQVVTFLDEGKAKEAQEFQSTPPRRW